jgi:hypothetical protein
MEHLYKDVTSTNAYSNIELEGESRKNEQTRERKESSKQVKSWAPTLV